MDRNKQARQGTLKTLVLGAGAIMISGAAESVHAGNIQHAIILGVLSLIAFGIHEAMTQYQFAWEDDFIKFVSQNTDVIDIPSGEKTEAESEDGN